MINLSELLLRDTKIVSGKSGIVVGSARSIRNLNRIPFAGIKIGIGDTPWRAPEFGPYDYWVTSNSEYPLIWNDAHFRDIANSKSTALISTASVGNLEPKSEKFFKKLGANNAFSKIVAYDQRHFGSKLCKPIQNCCLFSRTIVNELTIQELLGREAGLPGPAYSTGSTVAIQGFALGILLKLNPIYIVGVEIPTDIRDYSYIHNHKMRNESLRSKFKRIGLRKLTLTYSPTDFTNQYNGILKDFELLAEIARKFGIATYCVSETSALNKIPGIKAIRVNSK